MENTSNVLKGLVEIPNHYELVNELIEQRNKKESQHHPLSKSRNLSS